MNNEIKMNVEDTEKWNGYETVDFKAEIVICNFCLHRKFFSCFIYHLFPHSLLKMISRKKSKDIRERKYLYLPTTIQGLA